MILRQNVITQISESEEAIMQIAKITGRKFRTIKQWLMDNDELLTMAASLKVIKDFTGLTDDQILTEATEAVASKKAAEKAVT